MASFIVFLTLAIFIVYCQADGSDPPHGSPEMHFFQEASPAEVTKCLGEAKLTKDNLKDFNDTQPKEPSTKLLCFAKCLGIISGCIDKDGMIVSDMIKKKIPSFIDDETVDTSIKCMEAVGKITTCDDMSKILKCLPKPPKRPE